MLLPSVTSQQKRIKPMAGFKSLLSQLLIKSIRIFGGSRGPPEVLVMHSRDGEMSEKLSWGQRCSLVFICKTAESESAITANL